MTNKHLTSFVVLFENFFGYNKAKSMDELHQLIKHKIYNGSWDLFRNDWSESLKLYDKLTDGIKTYEDAFERMVVTLKGNNLDENQTTDFLDLTLEMYLVTSKSKGVLDNEFNEDYSFNRDHPNYNKFKVFSYLEKSFGLIVADFLSSKRPSQASLSKEFEGWEDYLEKKLDDCIAVNAGNNEDTVTILEISKENFNNIKNEKNFSNEILLNEICSVRFDDYPGIESVVPKEVFDEYKKIIQASLNKLSKDEDDSDEWEPEYIIHNGFIYCEKKIILLYDLPSKIYTDAESGNRERRYLY